MTVTIYEIECSRAYSMSEQGVGYSLSPWGSNTEYYEGDDDGGEEYDLPDGFEVAESNAGTLEIYVPDGSHYSLTSNAYRSGPLLAGVSGIIRLRVGVKI